MSGGGKCPRPVVTACREILIERWSSGYVLDCQARGTRFKPQPCRSEIWIQIFSHAHPYSACGTTRPRVAEPVSSLKLTQSKEERVKRMGANTSVVKKTMNEIQ